MIEVLTTLKNELEKLNIPYTFDNWDNEIEKLKEEIATIDGFIKKAHK